MGWFTIRPRTPYPEISVNYLTIDGASQTAFSGDTNPLGPEIEISGENMTGTAPMLTMRHGCRTALSNLAIDNAPGAALHLGDYVPAYDPKTCSFTTLVTPAYEYRNVAEIGHNYIGTDPTGRAAAPNFRGIAGDGADGFDIHDNIVSGNVASGIHLTDPSHTGIHDNFIGIAADGEPLGNGASGIYASASGSLYAQLLRIDRNVIAFNKHWAIDLGLPGNIEFASNRIYGNQLTAIGAFNTLGVSDQVFIDGAVFDPTTGMTAVHGHFVNRGFEPLQSGTVTLFRSFGLGLAGYGEAESPIGSAPVTQSGAWDFRYPGDLTGRYVTAIVTTSTIRTGGFTYDTYVQSYGLSAAVIVTR